MLGDGVGVGLLLVIDKFSNEGILYNKSNSHPVGTISLRRGDWCVGMGEGRIPAH